MARAFKSVGIKTVLIFGVHIQTRAGITRGHKSLHASVKIQWRPYFVRFTKYVS
jgi:hypothetical protein